ncbi:MAG: HIT domain-containing protein [Verrucomicrobiaceae bacterium]|nr:HIT domain-containing protein [Verrucomicrobiaceae bacterium]
MDRLHSYWRIPYIEAPKTNSNQKGDGNPFLEMATVAEEDFKKYHILWRGKYSFIVMNKFPYNCGHLLILPLREVADIEMLEGDEKTEFFDAIIKAKRILRLTMKPDAFNVGFNLGAKAGAGIPRHLHCHVVPRWDGDTNFMPVIADTRVLPQAMDSLWEKLMQNVNL